MEAIPSREGCALVTGGGARLGAAIVRRLSDDGWAVAIHGRKPGAAEALAAELTAGGRRAAALCAELSAPDAATTVFAEVTARLGPCSLLVNNAAMFEYDDIATLSADSLDAHYRTNLRAPLLLAQAFSRQLEGRGLIVNLLDQKVFNPNPDFLSYTIMKAALESATRLLAMALAPRIRVCGVAPGLSLRSGAQSEEGFEAAHARAPLGFGSRPEDIAEAVSFLVRVPSITGTTIVVDGGQSLIRRDRDIMFSYGIAPDAPVGP